MTATTPKRRLGTIAEACLEAKMSKVSLYAKMKSGQIRAYKRGERTLVDLDSIAEFNNNLEPWKPAPPDAPCRRQHKKREPNQDTEKG